MRSRSAPGFAVAVMFTLGGCASGSGLDVGPDGGVRDTGRPAESGGEAAPGHDGASGDGSIVLPQGDAGHVDSGDANAVDAGMADANAVDVQMADANAIDANATDSRAPDAETLDGAAGDAHGTDASEVGVADAPPVCATPADCPEPGNVCVAATCTLATCGTTPTAAGTSCGAGLVCDGAGSCVGCTAPSDCSGMDTECSQRTCVGGTCGVNDAAAGTACSTNGGAQCDGRGGCSQPVTVVRVGNGVAALSSSATAVFLETFFPLAGATPISTVALPTTLAGTNQPLLLGGSAITEGGLSRSGDGHDLVLAGYSVAVGGVTTAAGVTRVIGRVDPAGSVDTSTRLSATAFAGGSVRGAAAVDGSNFWVSGTSSGATAGGVWYVPLGAAGGGTQLCDTPNNMRQVGVFAGALYGDSGSGTFTSVLSFGGLPVTAGATATDLAGVTTTNPGGFVLLDLDATVPGVDTLFVADSGAATGLERWTFDGTSWTKDATFSPVSGGCLGVAGWATSSGATVVAAMSAGTLQWIDVPKVGAPVATLMTTAATNTAYRGVALAAQ